MDGKPLPSGYIIAPSLKTTFTDFTKMVRLSLKAGVTGDPKLDTLQPGEY